MYRLVIADRPAWTAAVSRHAHRMLNSAVRWWDSGVSVMGAAERALASNLSPPVCSPECRASTRSSAGSAVVTTRGTRMAKRFTCLFGRFRRAALGLVAAFFTPRKELMENLPEPSAMSAD